MVYVNMQVYIYGEDKGEGERKTQGMFFYSRESFLWADFRNSALTKFNSEAS